METVTALSVRVSELMLKQTLLQVTLMAGLETLRDAGMSEELRARLRTTIRASIGSMDRYTVGQVPDDARDRLVLSFLGGVSAALGLPEGGG